jgi:hypothetical protein
MISILRPIPIFDTNIFGHVQDGSISQKDWRFLLRHRPGHGWPLSIITALELLAGFQELHSDRFLEQKAQIELAYQLSKGHILEEPRVLLCEEVLRVPFPPELARLEVDVIADHIDVVRSANSLEEILTAGVLVKGLRTKGHGRLGHAGFQPSLLKELVAGPKNSWKENIENFASEIYPAWRERFQETRRRLPDDLRKDMKGSLVSEVERLRFAETIVRWLGGSTEPSSVAEVKKRLDAALEFTVYVLREFLARDYVLENHESDVYDQFQLHYLAMDQFVLVTEDSAMMTRTARCSQAGRIVSFETFLRSL